MRSFPQQAFCSLTMSEDSAGKAFDNREECYLYSVGLRFLNHSKSNLWCDLGAS
jgi:hypothetical protein